MRIATFNTELSRRGPGLLLQDIQRGKDPQVRAVVAVIARARPDILLLNGFDYDHGLVALGALADALAAEGLAYPHRFALRPNTGMTTGLDMDGDGRLGGPGDAQGFGRFAGAGGMAILSRLPIDKAGVQDFSGFLWKDLPGAIMPEVDGRPFPSQAAQAVQRLPTTGHWDVPVILPGGERIRLLAFHASPPVFDGEEDRNGRRNHDELAFWSAYLSGRLPMMGPEQAFVLLGDANLDPLDGDGRSGAISALLADPLLQDPRPQGIGGQEAASGAAPALDTVDWPEPDAAERPGPGNLRVDYVLPSADLPVTGSGVLWPSADDAFAAVANAASRHRLVWVDLMLDR